MSQYMKIKGIQGNVTTKGFEGCVELHHSNRTGNRLVRQQVGSGNREMGLLQLSHLEIQKSTDNASAELWQHFYTGKSIPELTITCCQLNNKNPEWHSKCTLSNVMVVSIYETNNEGGTGENIELAFSKIEQQFRSQSASGQWQTQKAVGFDIPTAK